MVEKSRPVTQKYYDYETLTKAFPVSEQSQKTVNADKTHQYKVSTPFTLSVDETYFVNEPYQKRHQNVPYSSPRTKEVTKTFVVNLPYTQHVTKSYTVDIPVQIINTAYRFIDQQIPVTKYRCVTRDTDAGKQSLWPTLADTQVIRLQISLRCHQKLRFATQKSGALKRQPTKCRTPTMSPFSVKFLSIQHYCPAQRNTLQNGSSHSFSTGASNCKTGRPRLRPLHSHRVLYRLRNTAGLPKLEK